MRADDAPGTHAKESKAAFIFSRFLGVTRESSLIRIPDFTFRVRRLVAF